MHTLDIGYILFTWCFAGIKSLAEFEAADLNYLEPVSSELGQSRLLWLGGTGSFWAYWDSKTTTRMENKDPEMRIYGEA